MRKNLQLREGHEVVATPESRDRVDLILPTAIPERAWNILFKESRRIINHTLAVINPVGDPAPKDDAPVIDSPLKLVAELRLRPDRAFVVGSFEPDSILKRSGRYRRIG